MTIVLHKLVPPRFSNGRYVLEEGSATTLSSQSTTILIIVVAVALFVLISLIVAIVCVTCDCFGKGRFKHRARWDWCGFGGLKSCCLLVFSAMLSCWDAGGMMPSCCLAVTPLSCQTVILTCRCSVMSTSTCSHAVMSLCRFAITPSCYYGFMSFQQVIKPYLTLKLVLTLRLRRHRKPRDPSTRYWSLKALRGCEVASLRMMHCHRK